MLFAAVDVLKWEERRLREVAAAYLVVAVGCLSDWHDEAEARTLSFRIVEHADVSMVQSDKTLGEVQSDACTPVRLALLRSVAQLVVTIEDLRSLLFRYSQAVVADSDLCVLHVRDE